MQTLALSHSLEHSFELALEAACLKNLHSHGRLRALMSIFR